MTHKGKLEDYIGCLYTLNGRNDILALVIDVEVKEAMRYNVAERKYEYHMREVIEFESIGGPQSGKIMTDGLHQFLARHSEVE